jgi:hypothetical protein
MCDIGKNVAHEHRSAPLPLITRTPAVKQPIGVSLSGANRRGEPVTIRLGKE